MKLPFKRDRGNVVALDIGSRLIKVVELGHGTSGPALLRYSVSHVSPDAVVEGEIMDRDLLVEAIEEAFEKIGIEKNNVISAISSRSVIVKRLLMDQMPEDEIRAVIEMEASSHIPFELEDVSLDFQVLDEMAADDKMEVLLVAAKREVIYEHTTLLRDLGLKTSVIDVDSFAIQNLYESLGTDQPLSTLVNVGAEVTNVNIVRDGMPLFTRDFSIGCGLYLEALQRDLQISYEGALELISTNDLEQTQDNEAGKECIGKLAEEIAVGLERSLAYLRSSGEVEDLSSVFLSGGGANLPNLKTNLEERLRIPVQIVDPISVLEVEDELMDELQNDGVASLLTVAVGLGMREVSR
ncbi:MAG: type IV pilus assembly protein PilM [bacterium]|nr:type IV pilus assembly protein PilM [bacterium]